MTNVWLNGQIFSANAAHIQVADRGFLLGEGAFETIRVCEGRPRRWPRHHERLVRGLEFLGLDAGVDRLGEAISMLAARNEVADGVARLTVSGGPGGPGLERQSGPLSTSIALTPRGDDARPVLATILPDPRRGGLPAERFKLSGYGGLIEARRAARAQGAQRAIVLGAGGAVACADNANVFWIRGREVFTPSLQTGALPGTCRAALIEACKSGGIFVQEVSVGPSDLLNAQAVFTTNAVEGVRAISRIDGRSFDPENAFLDRLAALERQAD